MKIVRDWLFMILLLSSIPASASSGGTVLVDSNQSLKKAELVF